MKRVLLIRCSHLDGLDPIQEIENLMLTNASAWFGKYGQGIGFPSPIHRDDTQSTRAHLSNNVILVALSSIERTAFFRLRNWSRTPPTDEGVFPQYYRAVMSRIGTWLELSEWTDEGDMSLDDLVIRSSRRSAKSALRASMRGHFWCSMP